MAQFSMEIMRLTGSVLRGNQHWMGVSLLAPHVRYTDHWHPPEETYLVLTDGEFMQEDHWFTPGVGGTFYNPPAIKHAMRSTDTPLLAFWALLPERRLDPA